MLNAFPTVFTFSVPLPLGFSIVEVTFQVSDVSFRILKFQGRGLPSCHQHAFIIGATIQ